MSGCMKQKGANYMNIGAVLYAAGIVLLLVFFDYQLRGQNKGK